MRIAAIYVRDIRVWNRPPRRHPATTSPRSPFLDPDALVGVFGQCVEGEYAMDAARESQTAPSQGPA